MEDPSINPARPTPPYADLAAADDAQRMLLWCVLHDAYEWHNSATADCVACQIAETCLKHWDRHGRPLLVYMRVMGRLEGCLGYASRTPCLLAADEIATLATALPYAIKYRAGRDRLEDDALRSAYDNLARQLTT